MTGAEGLSRSAVLYLAQQAQAVNPLQAPLSLNTNGSSLLDPSSVSISGLGQLFSALQQLQIQNPSQFSQIVAQVISSLRSEAQQQTGDASQYLTNLANAFQQAAVSCSLPLVYPPTELQAYNSPVQSYVDLTTTTAASTLQGFFTTLANKVSASPSA